VVRLRHVTTAIAQGDLTQKLKIQGEKEMSTKRHRQFHGGPIVSVRALKVKARGILGGQAKVEGVQGTWADLAKNVNKMASNLTDQVRSISEVTKAVALCDLGKLVT